MYKIGNPTESFHAQLAKLAAGLHSGDYSKPGSAEGGTFDTAGLPDEDGVKCVKNDEFCIQNEKLCIKTRNFVLK